MTWLVAAMVLAVLAGATAAAAPRFPTPRAREVAGDVAVLFLCVALLCLAWAIIPAALTTATTTGDDHPVPIPTQEDPP